MNDNFSDLEKLFHVFLSKLNSQELVRINRAIATTLRQSQSDRIGQQKNPDGSSYEPRKPSRRKKGRIKTGAMFKKIRTARYLKHLSTSTEIKIHFDKGVNRIAQIHHFGEMEERRGRRIFYPIRELLGLTQEEEKAILETIINHLDI